MTGHFRAWVFKVLGGTCIRSSVALVRCSRAASLVRSGRCSCGSSLRPAVAAAAPCCRPRCEGGRCGWHGDQTMPELGLAVATAPKPASPQQPARSKAYVRSCRTSSRSGCRRNEQQIEYTNEFGYPPSSGDNDTRFDLQWGHTAVDAVGAWASASAARVPRWPCSTAASSSTTPISPPASMQPSSVRSRRGLHTPITDPFCHGTHVAGTIGARDNGIGTIGMAPDATPRARQGPARVAAVRSRWIINGIFYAAHARRRGHHQHEPRRDAAQERLYR